MKKITKVLLTSAAVAMVSLLMSGSVNAAALIGELGILDLEANGGINPTTGNAWEAGDQYRLVFITSQTTDATSTDINTYNAFVQNVANAAGLGTGWKMVGSTATVDARDNTSTNPNTDGTGVSFFLTDGVTLLATDNADLWNGTAAPVNTDEYGQLFSEDRAFTGSEGNGTAMGGVGDRVLGGSSEDPSRVRTGRNDQAGTGWMRNYNVSASSLQSVFAMSDPLTIQALAVPEPSTLALGLFGLLGLVWHARCRRNN